MPGTQHSSTPTPGFSSKKKDYKKAREIIDQALEAFEKEEHENDNGEIYNHAGDIYFMDGDRKMALEMWKKAYELRPDDSLLAKKVKHKTISSKNRHSHDT